MNDGRSFPLVPRPLAPRPQAITGRALFLSDLHLGMIGCKAQQLLDFLRKHDAETIYLVGDAIDMWRPLGSNWPAPHHAVLQHLTRQTRRGRRVIYVPGNHDAFLRPHCGSTLFGFEIHDEAVHQTADGRRLLITHGDSCDIFSGRLAMLSRAGSHAEAGLRRFGQGIDILRRRLGREGWDGPEAALARINRLIRRRDRFDRRLSQLAEERGFDGIVCGHFHAPALHSENGVIYANCGDWVGHASAIMEDPLGKLSLIHWDGADAVVTVPDLDAEPELAWPR